MSYEKRTSAEFTIWGIILVIFFTIALFGTRCSDPDTTTRVLRENGYTSIQIIGPRFWGRSQGDTWATEFKAISPNGSYVTGYVSGGWFKGATIRFD